MSHNHKPGPDPVIPYFRSGFHTGRGPQLDDAVTDGQLVDLIEGFPEIKKAATDGTICYQKRLSIGPIERNVDLIIGRAARTGLGELPPNQLGWVEATPSDVWLGTEVKSMMTEHHKAQRNRRVEFNAHALNMHVVNPKAVRTGLCIINAADSYMSHTNKSKGTPNQHGNGLTRVASAINELSAIPERTDLDQIIGVDAMCVCVVVVDNVDLESAKWLGKNPAPADGNRLSYEHYIERTGRLLVERFLR